MSEEFSTFFEDAVRSLNVKPDKYYLSDTENLRDSVEIPILKFENHPNVQSITQNISVNQELTSFTLKPVIYLEILQP